MPLQTTAPLTDFTYAGMFTNADSSLDLTQYRAYNPAIGRWLSRDPLGEGSDPAANLYRYAGGNPVSFTDPGGNQIVLAIAAVEVAEDIFTGIEAAEALEGAEGAAAIADAEIADTGAAGEAATAEDEAAQDEAAEGGGSGEDNGPCGGGGGGGGQSGGVISSGTRYVGSGEAQVINDTGMVPNTNAAGAPKTIYYTPEAPLNSASAAQQAYQLPVTPDFAVELNPSGITNTYGGTVEGGSGIELTTNQPIPAIRITPLGP